MWWGRGLVADEGAYRIQTRRISGACLNTFPIAILEEVSMLQYS